MSGATSQMALTDFHNNYANDGGSVYADANTIIDVFQGVQMYSNYALEDGAAVYI